MFITWLNAHRRIPLLCDESGIGHLGVLLLTDHNNTDMKQDKVFPNGNKPIISIEITYSSPIDDPASAEMHCYNIGTMEHLSRAYAVKEGHSPRAT